MNTSGPLDSVYCTDEDVCVRATGDFAQLAPAWQSLAAGTDGAFDPADRWTLTSTTVDFGAQGVKPGHVCVLTLRGAFAPSGEAFAVGAVAGNACTLRRVGKPAGVGQPPAPAPGLAGVSFSVATLDPQIEEASYAVNNLEGIDPDLPWATQERLKDARELREFTVLTVLERQYAENVQGKDGAFALRLAQVSAQLVGVKARLVLKWGPKGESKSPTTFLSGRVGR